MADVSCRPTEPLNVHAAECRGALLLPDGAALEEDPEATPAVAAAVAAAGAGRNVGRDDSCYVAGATEYFREGPAAGGSSVNAGFRLRARGDAQSHWIWLLCQFEAAIFVAD
jgi:hypothetical protein